MTEEEELRILKEINAMYEPNPELGSDSEDASSFEEQVPNKDDHFLDYYCCHHSDPYHTATAHCDNLVQPPFEPDEVDLKNFPPERIRNFSIIAHIGIQFVIITNIITATTTAVSDCDSAIADHGKTTLSNRLFRYTGMNDYG